MRDKPALMLMTKGNARAMIDGRKWATRRLVKGEALTWLDQGFTPNFVADIENKFSPYGYAGDAVHIKETFWQFGSFEPTGEKTTHGRDKLRFHPTESAAMPVLYDEPSKDKLAQKKREYGYHKRPSLFMPREFCRLRPVIASVRIERLQEISADDAVAEGIKRFDGLYFINYMAGKEWYYDGQNQTHVPRLDAKGSFASLWDSINGAEDVCWTVNRWVWVVEFEKETMGEVRP